MAVEFSRVKEGEFLRLLKTRAINKVIANQSAERNKFHVIAIIADTQTAFTVRHGRVDELRTWRLDQLAALLNKHGVTRFDVQMRGYSDSKK